ncbi:MAG: response regulator transcription factor [Saprospiraceae bacterium]
MQVIIVDDEPKAIELLSSYVRMLDDLDLAGTFRNGLKALEFIHANPVDVLLLDIHMPHLNGLNLARLILAPTKIIFTTAHSEYAVESYHLNAIDYLLKPITLERFIQAIQKVRPAIQRPDEEVMLIKSGVRVYRVNPDDIAFLEKDGNYMLYHTIQERIMARQSIAEALAVLPSYFRQIHKSFIVNIRKINYFSKEEVKVQDRVLPVSPTHRSDLERDLQS